MVMPLPVSSPYGVNRFQPPQPPPYFPEPSFTARSHPAPIKQEAILAYHFLGPFQAAGLFGAGAAVSLAFRWVMKGLMLKPIAKEIEKETERKTNLTYSRGLAAMVKFLYNDPALKNRMMGYGSAIALGYGLLTLVQGWQEEIVRRMETCIRAKLLQQSTTIFQAGIEHKLSDENSLRHQATEDIRTELKKYHLNPDHYLRPNEFVASVADPVRYPGDPTPYTHALPLAALRFGNPVMTRPPNLFEQMSLTPGQIKGFKGLDVFGGFLAGLLVQGLFLMQHQPAKAAKTETKFFIENLEALFLDGDWKALGLTFGLSALAKGGKLIADGIREVRVTDENAKTELDYQRWVQQALDPQNRAIAEKASWKDHFNRFAAALPFNLSNPSWIKQTIQVLLDNIGRASVPVYMSSTWPVSLTPARG